MDFLKRIKNKLAHYTWDLAYGEYDEQILEKGLTGIKLHIVKNPYKKKWFADPFILSESNSELHLLVEEYDCDVKRGRIAHLTIDKKTDQIKDCKILLDISTHLSFPAIYRIGTKTYVHPENYQSGCSYIYEYNESDDVLENPVKLLDEPLADAVIQYSDEGYLLSATVAPNMNGGELCVYQSDSFWGPYTIKTTKKFCSYSARMAGAYIRSKGRNIRPAQDCSDAYGKGVVFYDDNKKIGCLYPSEYKKYCGLHTFNVKEKLFVIDLKKMDYPIIYNLYKIIKNIR